MFTPNEQLRLTARAGYYFRERDASSETKNRYRGFSGGLKGNYDFNTKSNLELAYISTSTTKVTIWYRIRMISATTVMCNTVYARFTIIRSTIRTRSPSEETIYEII